MFSLVGTGILLLLVEYNLFFLVACYSRAGLMGDYHPGVLAQGFEGV